MHLIGRRWIGIIPLIAVAVVGCAAPSAPVSPGATAEAGVAARTTVKRIVYATPYAIDITPIASLAARQGVLPLIGSGLSTTDGQGRRIPLLVEQLPSLDNGLWTVADDGTMVTTYHLRSDAKWHDGTPVTADDFVFTLGVGREGKVRAFGSPAYASIAATEATDPRTLVVSWKEPYNAADAIFDWSQSYGAPLPQHLLADAYATNPDGFLDLGYWTQGYVGTGPFKVVSWEPGVGIQLAAHDGYALGRPKLDRIDVQFIGDANTLIANLLTGSVDATSNVGSADAARQLQGQWQGGSVLIDAGAGAITAMYPQFIDPSPAVIADLPFRTALVIGIDRQAIVDQIDLGLSPVPLSFLNPNQAQYAALEASLPRFEYDPQRAAQMLADVGYAKGADGMLHDATGQPLSVEVRSAASGAVEQQARAAAIIGDHWQQLGIDTTLVREPPERSNDQQYTATFPGFYIRPRLGDIEGLSTFTTAHTPTASNNYLAPSPQNFGRYASPDLDAMIATYFRTIPTDQRLELMGQIVHTLADRLTIVGLWYNTNPGASNNRLTGVGPQWPNASFPWNAYAWDLKG